MHSLPLARISAGTQKTPARMIVNRHKSLDLSTSDTDGEDRNTSSEPRQATFILDLFKGNKFSRDIAQDITETLKLYQTPAQYNNISGIQKEKYFLLDFDGLARRSYFNNCTSDIISETKASIMLNEYSSDARKPPVKCTILIN
eukprot:GFKZ01008020.1.p1 GENE.GFKZ01008020.1~~GFKZ01008020.1.p1  ORF type:complete len:144 (+),score=11.43 GFKZ01008020.1:681-1112(+)